MKSLRKVAALSVLGAVTLAAPQANASASYCPKDAPVTFGVEPYEAAATLLPIYQAMGELIAKQLDCPVKVQITTNYTAEIEAMRSNKLDAAEFGPLGYVLAHKVAGAQAIASFANKKGQPATYYASVVTWPGSGIKTLKQVKGHTFAYSDPASTSGHLFPAFALKGAGIDPAHGVRAIFAGSHTSSYEAILHHKVQAGEMNSPTIQAASLQGEYNPKDFVTLWKSRPIPLDPITINPRINPTLKAKLTSVLQHLDLTSLPQKDQKIMGATGGRLVPQTDGAYDQIRDLVHVLNIDLNKLS